MHHIDIYHTYIYTLDMLCIYIYIYVNLAEVVMYSLHVYLDMYVSLNLINHHSSLYIADI